MKQHATMQVAMFNFSLPQNNISTFSMHDVPKIKNVKDWSGFLLTKKWAEN